MLKEFSFIKRCCFTQDYVRLNKVSLCLRHLFNCWGQVSFSSDSFFILFNNFATFVIGTSVHVYLASVGCFPIPIGLYIQTLEKPLNNIRDLTSLDPKLNSIQNYHATLWTLVKKFNCFCKCCKQFMGHENVQNSECLEEIVTFKYDLVTYFWKIFHRKISSLREFLLLIFGNCALWSCRISMKNVNLCWAFFLYHFVQTIWFPFTYKKGMCYLFNLISRTQEHFLVDFKNLKMIFRHGSRGEYYNYVGGSYVNAESFFVNCIFLYFCVFLQYQEKNVILKTS